MAGQFDPNTAQNLLEVRSCLFLLNRTNNTFWVRLRSSTSLRNSQGVIQ